MKNCKYYTQDAFKICYNCFCNRGGCALEFERKYIEAKNNEFYYISIINTDSVYAILIKNEYPELYVKYKKLSMLK